MRWLRGVVLAIGVAGPALVLAQDAQSIVDADRDGVYDALEAELLERFRPQMFVAADDCSVLPAQFASGMRVPTVVTDDGTLYGQAFRPSTASDGTVELHFYHLWRRDCGRMGHALDTEHVSALLHGIGDDAATYRAAYWYASAHEDTVCDASQITRAETLHAESSGAAIWVSRGKHASFLTEEMCRHGCGSDRCEAGLPLPARAVVNIGEQAAPMNGAVWVSAQTWPLAEKMTRSDFDVMRVARLERLPATDIAWANPAKRPAQALLLGGNAAVDGAGTGAAHTGSALRTGGHSVDTALVVATHSTGGAVGTAARSTGHALGATGRAVGKAVHSVGRVFSPAEKHPAQETQETPTPAKQ